MEKPWAAEYIDLASRFLDDDEREFLYRQYPNLPQTWKQGCPTCHGAKKYLWRDEIFPCDCRMQFALHKHYLAAGIGELYQRLDWDDYEGDPDALKPVELYLRKHREYINAGIGLFFSGAFGLGKTMLVSLIAKELVKLGYAVFFSTFSAMIDQFTKGWGDVQERQRFERKMVESDVLVLDDVGKEFRSSTNLAASTFDHILRQRAVALRPTIITTNMGEDDLSEGYGAGILSLLLERGLGYEVQGSDFRESAKKRAIREIEVGWIRPIF